jgi:hypothetical protein
MSKLSGAFEGLANVRAREDTHISKMFDKSKIWGVTQVFGNNKNGSCYHLK